MLDIAILVFTVVMGIVAGNAWRRQGRSLRKEYGLLGGWWALGDFAAGMLITFLAMLGIFLVELAMGLISVTGTVGFTMTAGDLGLMVFGFIYEEVFFRSLLLSGLVVVLGGRKWLAILITAALFGIIHLSNPGASPLSAFGNALGGVIYSIAFLGGKNLWLPLGLHFSWNFSQGPIFSFPVSGIDFGGIVIQEPTGSTLLNGGAYGPEAGLVGMVFRFVIMLMVVLYLLWRSNGRGNLKRLEFPIQGYGVAEPARAVRPAAS
jgi:membrane protease YdiL (CAAX protease family)